MKNLKGLLKSALPLIIAGGLVAGGITIRNHTKPYIFNYNKLQSRDTVEVDGIKYVKETFKNNRSIYISVTKDSDPYTLDLSDMWAWVLVDIGNNGIDYEIHNWRDKVRSGNSIYKFK